MRIQVTKPLFAWDCLEDGPTLKTIRHLLEVIPDQTLLDSLGTARGKGRDDVPVRGGSAWFNRHRRHFFMRYNGGLRIWDARQSLGVGFQPCTHGSKTSKYEKYHVQRPPIDAH